MPSDPKQYILFAICIPPVKPHPEGDRSVIGDRIIVWPLQDIVFLRSCCA